MTKIIRSTWTAEQDAQLEKWKHLGVPTVAKRLHRTSAAVRNRIHRLKNGLTAPHKEEKKAVPVLKPKAATKAFMLDKLRKMEAEIAIMQVKAQAYREIIQDLG